MPVFLVECPDCLHRFKGMVFEGAKLPDIWVCSKCKSDRAAPMNGVEPARHPWDIKSGNSDHRHQHGAKGGCPCCVI